MTNRALVCTRMAALSLASKRCGQHSSPGEEQVFTARDDELIAVERSLVLADGDRIEPAIRAAASASNPAPPRVAPTTEAEANSLR
ncbi:hypothetical protein [Amycolatopsis sp. NPDC001319]|uniref:hypothetical protein n=1 Tax=unclassified Amycolatopsis TaxID=2618356 RepID=UPI0036A6BFA5